MPMQKTLGRGLATSAQLALLALLSTGFAATPHDSAANTSSFLKTKVFVAAPSKQDLVAASQTDRLDKAMGALSFKDAALYRVLFAAQERGDWSRADDIQSRISDKRLMGYALADRYMRNKASPAALFDWLEAYPTLPQAEDIYAMARKAGIVNPPRPQAPETWNGADEAESAANFTPQLMVESTAPNSDNKSLAKAVQAALRKGDPWGARNLLIKAQSDKKLTGTFAHDVEALIAAAFFAAGERDQATSLSSAAAGANQPLGLWILGLIAWEKADWQTSRANFTRLAAHPALSETNRSAAHFWAYRAEFRAGSKQDAHKHLEAAASAAPRSFYGMLASQLVGRNPLADLASADKQPVWGEAYRDLLAANHAGWRALALIQIGQPQRAEAELRRLNPQGDLEKQQAMLALAAYVPMPALLLKLAHLSKDRGFDTALYPLLPWQPEEGYQIDRALLFALARHESLFEPAAVSSRGAQGLLQLMPKTALVMAKAQQQEGSNPSAEQANVPRGKLLDPSYNITLGQKYVQHLAAMPQIGGNLVMLLASYNAGPGKVINWAASRDGQDPLLFLESFPLRETRNYVARVLPHYWAYRARLGKNTGSLRQLAEGRWPAVTLTEEAAAPKLVQAAR